jgi:hypothetical protein
MKACIPSSIQILTMCVIFACNGAHASWEECKTTKMLLRNKWWYVVQMWLPELDIFIHFNFCTAAPALTAVSQMFLFIPVCRINNLDVITSSRLLAGQSVQECMAKCRKNQECYSFNYNKLTKWCYIGSTEELDMRQAKNSKWAAG